MKLIEAQVIKMIINEDLTLLEKLLVQEIELKQALKKSLKQMGRKQFDKTIKSLIKEL